VAALATVLLTLTSSSFAQVHDPKPAAIHLIEVEEGVTLHVVDWGGTGESLLFVPSWASTAHTFDTFAPRFSDAYHVLVMNVRGHGPSSRPDGGYTIDRLVKDIEAVLDKLSIGRVTLVGLSRSESLTTQFAALHPDRVSGLIYLSGPIDREYDRAFAAQPGVRSKRIERSQADDAILQACGIVEERAFPPGSDDAAANQLGTEWRNTDPAPPYASVRAPALAFWAPITARVLQHRLACAAAGRNDAAVDGLIARFTKASLPFFEQEVHNLATFKTNMANGSIVVIPGADYNTFLSHPALVEEEIRRFLKR
jgi:pimeloyl-ACP methyl ester carboxylesterase